MDLSLSINDIFNEFCNSFISSDCTNGDIFESFVFSDIFWSKTVFLNWFSIISVCCSSLNKSFPIIPENSSQNEALLNNKGTYYQLYTGAFELE